MNWLLEFFKRGRFISIVIAFGGMAFIKIIFGGEVNVWWMILSFCLIYLLVELIVYLRNFSINYNGKRKLKKEEKEEQNWEKKNWYINVKRCYDHLNDNDKKCLWLVLTKCEKDQFDKYTRIFSVRDEISTCWGVVKLSCRIGNNYDYRPLYNEQISQDYIYIKFNHYLYDIAYKDMIEKRFIKADK